MFYYLSIYIFPSEAGTGLAITILIMSTTTTATTKMSFSRLVQQEFGKFGPNSARVEIV